MFPMPFMKKKADEPKKVYIPVDLVLSYAAQGFSESEIFTRLQSQGFESEHIDRAIKIALKERVTASPGVNMNQQQPSLPQPSSNDFYGASPEPVVSRRPPTPLGYPPERIVSQEEARPPTLDDMKASFTFEPKDVQTPQSPVEEITVEELIEGIVTERWRDFEERLIDFEKRDMQLQAQMDDLRKRFKEIDNSISEREKGLSGKMEDFGGSMDDIQGRIGSIERAFREVLPELTVNIKTMTNFVEKIKEEEKK
jgi:hypothetical protein